MSAALVVHAVGEGAVVSVDDVPEPTLGEDGVLIEVEAVALTFVDWLSVRGGHPVPVPFVAGTQLAGTVAEVGEGATQRWKPGDAVLAGLDVGAASALVAAPADRLVAIPASVTSVDAVSWFQPYAAGSCALVHRAQVVADDVVVVLGANGSVGRACVEISRRAGARVVAVAYPSIPADVGATAGCAWVLPDGIAAGLAEVGAPKATVVVDMVGGDLSEQAFRRLDAYGRHVVVGFASGSVTSFRADRVLRASRSILGSDTYAWFDSRPAEAAEVIHEALSAAQRGELRSWHPTLVDLEEAARTLLAEQPPVGPLVVSLRA